MGGCSNVASRVFMPGPRLWTDVTQGQWRISVSQWGVFREPWSRAEVFLEPPGHHAERLLEASNESPPGSQGSQAYIIWEPWVRHHQGAKEIRRLLGASRISGRCCLGASSEDIKASRKSGRSLLGYSTKLSKRLLASAMEKDQLPPQASWQPPAPPGGTQGGSQGFLSFNKFKII